MIKGRDIFIFSLSDWSEEMISNRYQMAARFARQNRVFFFERPIIPTFHDFKRWGEYFRPIEKKSKNLYLIKPPAAPNRTIQKNIDIFYIQKIIATFNAQKPIFWFYNFQAGYLIDFFKPELACYHCTEDYQGVSILNQSKYLDETLTLEKELTEKADLIFAVSEEIARTHKLINPLTYRTLNAVDYEFYKNAQGKPGADPNHKKTIGLIGSLSPIVDFKKLNYLAEKLPGIKMILIGPVTARDKHLSRLKHKHNVEFLTKQPLVKLPALMQSFDVCLISYIQDEWFTKAAQPLKLFEYLASGKPIVSTPMDCLKNLQSLVYIGKSDQEYLAKVKIALKENDPRLQKKRIQLAQNNTWDDRFTFINQKIEKYLSGELVRPRRILANSLEYFQKRKKPWLLDGQDIKIESEKALKEGEKILNHEFTVLNKTRKFGQKIDWSAAFDSKKSWARGHFETLNQTTYTNGFQNQFYIGDIKLPWEFNKHLHFITLSECYLATHDARYAQEFIDEIIDWIKQNPYEHNQAWTQTLIVSHRAIAWVIALGRFINSPLMTEEIWAKIFTSLGQHADYIEKHYEVGEQSSNHLLGNLSAQIILCSVFPEIDGSLIKITRALNMLEDELAKQIYPDGSDYEQSLSYHRVILEFLLLVGLADKKKLVKLSTKTKNIIKKMTEFLRFAAQPNGFYQPISDADGARVFIVNNNVLDSRPYLQFAAQIFGRVKPKKTSKVFPDSGYAFLRKDWSKNTPWLFFDSGPIGMGKNHEDIDLGTHGHSDTLNFGLAIGHETIITDIGSYAYTTERPLHHYFRSSAGHNVPIVDGQDANILSDFPWTLRQVAQGKNFKSVLKKDIDYVSGEHYGYHRLKKPIDVRREIIFHKKENWVAIRDSFTGVGEHEVTELFHLYPGLTTKIGKNYIDINSQMRLRITPLFDYKIAVETSWYALDYGLKTEAQVIKISSDIKAPARLTTLLNWGANDIKIERINKEMEALNGKAR